LSIKDNLGMRCVLLDEGSLCVSECGGVESAHHLFLNCNTFDFLWFLVYDLVGVSAVDPNSIVAHFHLYAYLAGGLKKR